MTEDWTNTSRSAKPEDQNRVRAHK